MKIQPIEQQNITIIKKTQELAAAGSQDTQVKIILNRISNLGKAIHADNINHPTSKESNGKSISSKKLNII